MEVLRRCPLAIAQRLVYCAIAVSTAVLDRVTKKMSVAPLLTNNLDNSKQKTSNLLSPALPPYSWSLLGKCEGPAPPPSSKISWSLDLAWNPVIGRKTPSYLLMNHSVFICPISCKPLCFSVLYLVTHSVFIHPTSYESLCVYVLYLVNLCVYPSCTMWIIQCLCITYLMSHSVFMCSISSEPQCLSYVLWTTLCLSQCLINYLVNLCVYLSCTLWIIQCLCITYLINHSVFICSISSKPLCLSYILWTTLCLSVL